VPVPFTGNVQGTWSLSVTSQGQAGAIECWCVEARGASTGILVSPETSTARAFEYCTLTATVVVDGFPAAGVPLTFRVTDRRRPELSLIAAVTTHTDGVAEFTYTREGAGDDLVRVDLAPTSDPLIYGEAEVTWEPTARCPLDAVAGFEAADAAREVRDGVLARTERGRRYTDLYYRFAGEAVRIMMLNPMLMLRSREIVERYEPVIEAMAAGREVTLTPGDLDEIEALLTAFGDRGSAELRDAIRAACRDLRNPEVRTEFRVRLADGPGTSRGGAEPQSRGGVPAGLGLFGVLAVGLRWRRPRPSRRRSRAAASLAIVGLALSSLPAAASAGDAARFATYLGGSGDDQANAVAVDAAGNTYVVGFTDSPDFPTAAAAQSTYRGGAQDAFVAKLDPSGAVVYSTYLGGSGQDNAAAVAIDAAGNAYVTGFTGSRDFPVLDAAQGANAGAFNAFVAKLSPSGALLSSTYLGGRAGDFGSGIAVGADGDVTVAGVATSPDFPPGPALQPATGGGADAFVVRLDGQTAGVTFAARLGGSGNDGATSVVVDAEGGVYVSGVTSSADFPTARAAQAAYGGGLFDGFAAKIDAARGRLNYATYLGGSGDDRAYRLAVGADGSAVVVGDTDSADLRTARALQPDLAGAVDAFVAALDRSGALAVATYLGGSGVDGATAVALDGAGGVHVVGFTGSSDFPSSDAEPAGGFDAFAARLAPAGTAVLGSTYFGGSGTDAGFGVAVGAGGEIVMGQTDSPDLPTSGAAQPAFGGGASDVFVAALEAPPSTGPTISGAAVRGNKLIVTGAGFDAGAAILVDGRGLKTRNDPRSPATSLVGKRPRVGVGQTVTLVVRNADGTLSPGFRFTR
jgi:hypothetical protein